MLIILQWLHHEKLYHHASIACSQNAVQIGKKESFVQKKGQKESIPSEACQHPHTYVPAAV